VKGDKGQTLALVEVADSDIHWMEPRDLDVADMSWNIQDQPHPSISSLHPYGGANVSTVDARCRFIKSNTPPEVLKAMTTINGGETADWP
jgi:hypothetical protein